MASNLLTEDETLVNWDPAAIRRVWQAGGATEDSSEEVDLSEDDVNSLLHLSPEEVLSHTTASSQDSGLGTYDPAQRGSPSL